ncbi:hypothetical protein C4D60_Mb01t14590 [Musa balbisiana]|uniref:Uncharacterized protein n=1 Tax=Musa balbisiana TaxID=52838 RepID=A0A4S8JN51_MUSBA|nr:hypothetical protein C4D60_Mb01t14590 [Musa balbisiana]
MVESRLLVPGNAVDDISIRALHEFMKQSESTQTKAQHHHHHHHHHHLHQAPAVASVKERRRGMKAEEEDVS